VRHLKRGLAPVTVQMCGKAGAQYFPMCGYLFARRVSSQMGLQGIFMLCCQTFAHVCQKCILNKCSGIVARCWSVTTLNPNMGPRRKALFAYCDKCLASPGIDRAGKRMSRKGPGQMPQQSGQGLIDRLVLRNHWGNRRLLRPAALIRSANAHGYLPTLSGLVAL